MAGALSTPVAAAVVTGRADPPDGVGRALSAPAVVGVPAAADPLRAAGAPAAYRRALAAVRSGADGGARVRPPADPARPSPRPAARRRRNLQSKPLGVRRR